ncbi:hypothetical protein AB1L30_16350 [Bremerella sp. JC817]|uniref:hypothetical protein n=1 Tax=Bremerella sp. JC817 TaxID=3231756 RepID=UPI00345ACD4B
MSGDSHEHFEFRLTFSLWALAIVIALWGIVFAILRLLGPFAATMTCLFLLISAVHLGASFLSRRMGLEKKRLPRPPVPPPSGETKPKGKPRWKGPNLAERTRVSIWQIGLAGQSIALGAVAGGIGSSWVPAHQFNYGVLAVCVLSGAALSGMGCFVTTNLVEHLWRSLHSAWQGEFTKATDQAT